jgi:hypothetical protein
MGVHYKKLYMNTMHSTSSVSTISQYTRALWKLRDYEKSPEYSNEFFKLSSDQIYEIILRILEGVTKKTTIDQHTSVYKNYLEWAVDKGLRGKELGSYDSISFKIKKMKAKDWFNAEVDRFVTREQVYNLIDKLKIKRDSAVYLALFEGIYDKGNKKLLNIKNTDLLKVKDRILINGEEEMFHTKLVGHLKVTSKCLSYFDENSKERFYEDPEFVIKTPSVKNGRKKSRDNILISDILRTKSEKQIGKKIVTSDLIDSGFCYYLACIESMKGKVEEDDVLKVAKKFNKNTESNSNFYKLNNIYFNYFKLYCERYNVKITYDDEIIKILEEIERIDVVYPKDYTGGKKYIPSEWESLGEVAAIKEIEELTDEENEFVDNTGSLLNKFLDKTEQDIIIKARVGQGIFRKKLLTRSNKCELCGFDYIKLLIASHCKPWRMCDKFDKLNINNGLLLCPDHDSLFDKGLISFNDDGSIILSDILNSKQYNLLNIKGNEKLKLNDKQVEFIEWHRKCYLNNFFELIR